MFDRVVINGGADALANSIKELGLGFREVQTGKVQNYMLLVLLMTIIIFILFEIPSACYALRLTGDNPWTGYSTTC